MYGEFILNKPNSELTDTAYVSIKLIIDSVINIFITLTDSFIYVNFDKLNKFKTLFNFCHCPFLFFWFNF